MQAPSRLQSLEAALSRWHWLLWPAPVSPLAGLVAVPQLCCGERRPEKEQSGRLTCTGLSRVKLVRKQEESMPAIQPKH